jgi:hypothetical protein
MNKKEFNMFSKSRLKFSELYSDALSYLKKIYGEVGDYFSNASPTGQLLRVILHLGRMIIYYIEDSITELNINTAIRARSVRGLATLTGHNPSRGMAARGVIKFVYNNSDLDGHTIIIPNYTRIINLGNGLKYSIIIPNDNMKIVLTTNNVFENISIIQGELRYQQGTADGYALSSINFPKQDDSIIDQYYCNVFVNGKKWKNVDSILDMGYDEEACIIKTGQSGGIDVFFGSGSNGKIPPMGATILLEYIASNGEMGNINDINESSNNYWRFETEGYLPNGEKIDLNEILKITTQKQILFGCNEESISLTKLIAPHTSRSFVLANAENYKYFLRKLNIFSVIDAIQGFNTYDDIKARYEYNNAYAELSTLNNNYYQAKELYGANSSTTKELYDKILSQKNKCEYWKNIYEQTKLDDNTIYLFLIPNILKRIGETNNYFTCSKNAFNLTNDEKYAIKDLIEKSGQQMITTDVEIISPKIANFSINCFIQMWEGFEFNNVKNDIINNVSNYLIRNNRRDRLPISDLVKVVEEVNGVDSVSIMFDADKKNDKIYGQGNYGIDEFGDIIISRYLRDENGNKIEVKDILPMFRGGFTSFNDIEYGEELNDGIGPINISLRGISYK